MTRELEARAKRIWAGMRQRCNNPKGSQYHNYGGRGIRVCERWATFTNFLADMGYPPAGLSIDRIDNNGNYEPGNCRWADAATQGRNKRTCIHVEGSGMRMTTEEWGPVIGIDPESIRRRLKRGESDVLRPPRVQAIPESIRQAVASEYRYRVPGRTIAPLAKKYGISRCSVERILHEAKEQSNG